MSERGHEHLKSQPTPEAHSTEHLKHRPTPEKHNTKHEHKENLDEIQRSIEQHAKKAHETKHHHSPESSQGGSEAFVTKELKVLAFNRTMSRIRRNLSPIDRTMSKVIHNQGVDKVSTAMEKTVARPSSLLVGGTLAVTGGFAYFYIAKHYGYEYNAGVLIMLFVIGYLIGLLFELIKKATHSR